jgi:C_GCAxxG_C_C family probable redox protein
MQDEAFLVAELSLRGFSCSHILAAVGLEAQGRDSPELMRAMSGLALGMSCGQLCGALSGGCCLLGLYAGMDENRDVHPSLPLMLEEFNEWFKDEYVPKYGGINCADIMQNNPALKNERCPPMILAAVRKAIEILDAYGFPLDAPHGERDGY